MAHEADTKAERGRAVGHPAPRLALTPAEAAAVAAACESWPTVAPSGLYQLSARAQRAVDLAIDLMLGQWLRIARAVGPEKGIG